MPSHVRTSCFAGLDPVQIPTFSRVLKRAGVPLLAVVSRLNVAELGKRQPDLLICDIDGSDTDSLELLRELRFVLPTCIIVVYTAVLKRSWSIACHLAGANGLLLKDSTASELSSGVRGALRTGCFTDPRFAAA
jgi:DNA-binding NarL/FixJ family response regulator